MEWIMLARKRVVVDKRVHSIVAVRAIEEYDPPVSEITLLRHHPRCLGGTETAKGDLIRITKLTGGITHDVPRDFCVRGKR